MKELFIAILIVILSGTDVFATECHERFARFLSQPTYRNYLAIGIPQLSESSDKCWVDQASDYRSNAKLFEYVKRANQWAIRILAKNLLRNLDGGELEDAFRALGASIDANPKVLLGIFKEGQVTQTQFTDAVSMLSLSFVDNKNSTLSALKSRKRKILSVKDSTLDDQKRLALKSLDDEIKHIAEVWPD